MNKNDCKDCAAFKQCQDSFTSWVFLFIGLIATLALRVINLVMGYGLFWSKFSWYVGVAGFLIYFFYKFRLDQAVRKQLEQNSLTKRMIKKEDLTEQDIEFLRSIVCRLRSNKDSINYFFIFFSSGLVLLLAVYQDFIKR